MAATRSKAKPWKAKQSSKAPKSGTKEAEASEPPARRGPGRPKTTEISKPTGRRLGRPRKAEQPRPKPTAATSVIQGTLQADIKRKINAARELRAALSNFRGMLTRARIGSLVDNELIEDVGLLTKRAGGKLMVLESERYWVEHAMRVV